jgi:hypothetical protein
MSGMTNGRPDNETDWNEFFWAVMGLVFVVVFDIYCG